MLCSVEGCNRLSKYKGMCGMHYKRQWRHGDVDYCDDRTKPVNLEKCLVEGCELRGATKGYCHTHYLRWTRYGRTHRIKGYGEDGYINAGGYVVIRGKYEHIMLAEKALGEKLPEGAVVHHTGKPWDNHGFCKLVVCPSQDYHLLIHRRMKELGYENNQD